MFRTILPVLALSTATLGDARAQFPGYYGPPRPVPVPVYAPQMQHHVHHAPPVYTMDDFLKCFRPTEGHHRVWFVHPCTNRPVEVCFDLPCGRLREVEVNRHSIEFDYIGARDVRIVFRSNGTVDVRQ